MQHTRARSFFSILLIALFVPLVSVHAAGSLTIQSLAPGGTVSVGTPVTFTVAQTGMTAPIYTITDDVGTNLVPNLNAQGSFSWTPYTRDLGTHNITISAQDSFGNSATVAQAITVIQPTASIGTIVNGPTAYVGMPMTFQITTTGFTNPTYWLGDSVGGSTLNNSRLNASGAFSWTPSNLDLGQHKMMISVNDQYGHSVDLSQDVTVLPTPTPQVTGLSPGTTTPVGGVVTFTVTSPGYTNPTFDVHDSYSPSTVTSSMINASGVFTWTPVGSQTGNHNIRVTVTGNNGQSKDVIQQIIVLSPTLSVEGFTTGSSVSVGDTLKFTVVKSGMTDVTYSVNDTFSGSINSNTMSASGLFVWTPNGSDVGRHNIGIIGVDTYGNSANVHVDINVVPKAAELPVQTPNLVAQPVSVTPGTSPPAPTYVFTKSLALGSTGAEVLALQQLLAKLGFLTATPNGTFGPMTAVAVKKFQSANGLSPVGSVGPGTRAKLNAQGGTGSGVFRFTLPLALGATGVEVTELQKKLVKLGFMSGPTNGIFDTVTQAAVKKFQAAKGLEPVGSVGPGTRAALNAS